VSLTGLPLILLTWILAIVALAATVRWWRLTGRWRPGLVRLAVRVTGLVAIEVLIVAGIGLIENRQNSFYPSWRALGGTQNVVTVPSAPAGRLDGRLDSHTSVTWSPREATAWRLAGAPRLIVPADYAGHPDSMFPVVVILTSEGEARDLTAPAPGVVTVVLVPTAATTAPALAGLPASLGEDARVTDRMVILADPRWTRLAQAWPGRPPVLTGHSAAAFDQAVRDLPAPLAAPERLPS